MPPTEQTLATLAAFHKWTKSLFGKAEPVFSCKHHIRPNDMVEINRGTMRLLCHDDGTFSLYDYSGGMTVAVSVFEKPMERVLMAGLQWAIRRKFYDTYES